MTYPIYSSMNNLLQLSWYVGEHEDHLRVDGIYEVFTGRRSHIQFLMIHHQHVRQLHHLWHRTCHRSSGKAGDIRLRLLWFNHHPYKWFDVNLHKWKSLTTIHRNQSYNSHYSTRERREYPHNTRIKITRAQSHRVTRTAQNRALVSLESPECVVAEC